MLVSGWTNNWDFVYETHLILTESQLLQNQHFLQNGRFVYVVNFESVVTEIRGDYYRSRAWMLGVKHLPVGWDLILLSTSTVLIGSPLRLLIPLKQFKITLNSSWICPIKVIPPLIKGRTCSPFTTPFGLWWRKCWEKITPMWLCSTPGSHSTWNSRTFAWRRDRHTSMNLFTTVILHSLRRSILEGNCF